MKKLLLYFIELYILIFLLGVIKIQRIQQQATVDFANIVTLGVRIENSRFSQKNQKFTHPYWHYLGLLTVERIKKFQPIPCTRKDNDSGLFISLEEKEAGIIYEYINFDNNKQIHYHQKCYTDPLLN